MQAATFLNPWLVAVTLALLLVSPAAPVWGAEPPAPTTGPGCGIVSPPPPTGPLTLHSLRIQGVKTVTLQDLKKEMSIQVPSFWPPWKKAATFRPVDLDYDVDRLQRFYRRQGFFHAKISPEIKYLPAGEADVALVIDEGPYAKVSQVEVEIKDTGLDLSELRKKWPLQPGDRFTEKAYDGLKNLYLNYLPNHGYPRVKVTGQVLLDEEQNTATIRLTVQPGPLSYFGAARVQDEDKLAVPVKAIMERLTFKEGQVFTLEELFKTQRKLYETDLFRSVVLTPEAVPAGQQRIPITIQVEEKKKRSLRLGLGYGDEDLIRARVGLRYRNLWGGGRVLDLDSRYSSLGYLITETFTNPVIWGSSFDFVHQSGARRRDLPGFTDQAYFTQARLEHDLAWDFRYYFGYGLEFSRPFDIPVETLIRLQGTAPEKVYRASYALFGLRQDTVDNHIEPTEGGIITFSNEVAPTFMGSQLQYAQTVVEAKRYQSLGDSGFVLAGRVKFGLIQPMQTTGQIPIQKRFFSGGANSVRGYKLDFLGPRNNGGDPIGGDAVIEASLEGRFPLPLPIYNRKIGGVVFMDAGNVYLKARNIDLGQLKYAPGVGLRYLSPIGAIGVDVAFPLNRISYSQDRPYQFHFTIGYGF
jgi:outer membrane protein assembly complex protein YaeT